METDQPKPTRAEVLAAVERLQEAAHTCGHNNRGMYGRYQEACSQAKKDLRALVERLTAPEPGAGEEGSDG